MKKKIKYYLKDPNADDATLIVLKTTIAPYVRFTYSTGEHVSPTNWDKDNMRVLPVDPNAEEKNMALDQLAITCEAVRLELKNGGKEITKREMKKKLDSRLGVMRAREHFNLVTLGRRLYENNPGQSPLNSVTNHISEFSAKHKRPIDFAEITPEWVEAFERFLFNKTYLKGGKQVHYRVGSINRWMKALTQILNASLRYDYRVHPGISQTVKKRKSKDKPADKVTLSLEEVRQLYEHEFSSTRLSRARDRFVVACLVGLRHCDWEAISMKEKGAIVEVDNMLFLEVINQKTDTRVFVPLLRQAKKILDEMGGEFVKISNDKDRKNIREACKVAGIDARVGITERRGTKTDTQYFEKWEKIMCHTSRYTWNAALRDEGMPDYLIKLLLAHSNAGKVDSDMTSRYDRRDFARIAPAMIPYLREIEKKLNPFTGEIRFF